MIRFRLMHPSFCSRCDKPVRRSHYRRCKHHAADLSEVMPAELRAAGSQLYRAAKVACDLSRNGGKVMSPGQRDTMHYALKRWEKMSRLLESRDIAGGEQ